MKRVLLVALALIAACGTREGSPHRLFFKSVRGDQPLAQAAPAPAMDAVGAVAAAPAEGRSAESDPLAPVAGSLDRTMIIRTGQASVEVDSLPPAIAAVRALAARLGGYLANTEIQTGQERYHSATIEVKVPADQFEHALEGLRPIGKVESVNVTAEDVGEEFVDVAARSENDKRLERRLLDLLANRTGKLGDIIEIERELARVREEIERYDGRLRYLRAHADVSSLTITVHEPTPVVGEQGSPGVIAEAFVQAWRNFVDLLAWAIQTLGFVAPIGVVLLAGWLGTRRFWKQRRAPA
ncbi:MAG TPA: DUF4349 domain-containing protein [Gemmatimonadales bacterium]|nr:DUF4349 domain-containing protein [Gemmatimonadales bacterium]